MTLRMLRRDLGHNRVLSVTLVLFIALAALLVCLSAALLVELVGAMDGLFEDALAPHFVQMHSGDIDPGAIDDFAAGQPWVTAHQIVAMQNVPGRAVTLGSSGVTEAASVMDIAFVTQNNRFDFLIDLSGNVARVAPGEVGVPVYYMQARGLAVGDTVRIDCGDSELELVIAAFVRDVQMNPSMVSSKRLLVHPSDWTTIRETIGTPEYLIEFLLDDPAHAGDFEELYTAAGLPASDTAITYGLYRMLSALSDGVVAAVLILIGLLLVVIAMLCLRYTLLGAVAEDTREIGIMKAIGLSAGDTRRAYWVKYASLSAMACLLGYALSLPMQHILVKNIALYMGLAERGAHSYLVPLTATGAVFLAVMLLVRLTLRRLQRLSAVEALRTGAMRDAPTGRRRLSLRRSRVKQVNILLALQDLWQRLGSYALLGFIFAVCAFLAITPVNLYSTMTSPHFITYMGAGASDLRIDLQHAGDIEAAYEQIAAHLDTDPDIIRYTAFVTGTFEALDSEETWTTIKVETGDFSVFPLSYSKGYAPVTNREIALSAMNADALGKSVGDSLTLMVDGSPRALTVCGIYQDVTNGGKTAKAQLPVNRDNMLWYVINMDVADSVDAAQKKAAYAERFADAKVLDMADYLTQTMGAITDPLFAAAVGAIAVASLIGMLITAMFFHMMLQKDASQTRILRSIGFGLHDLHIQYILRASVVLTAGILLGTLAVGVLGQGLCGLLFGALGAPDIRFTVNPAVSYLLCPALLLVSGILTAQTSSRSINNKVALRPTAE